MKKSIPLRLLLTITLAFSTGCSTLRSHSVYQGEAKAYPSFQTAKFLTPEKGFAVVAVDKSARVMKTDDGGKNWQQVADTTDAENVGRGTLDWIGFSSAQEGLICGPSGALVTKDGGENWTDVHMGDPRAYDAVDGVGVFSTRSGLYVHQAGTEPKKGELHSRIKNGKRNERKMIAHNIRVLNQKQMLSWCSTAVYYSANGGQSWYGLPVKGASSYKKGSEMIAHLATAPGEKKPFIWVARDGKRDLIRYKPKKEGGGYDAEELKLDFGFQNDRLKALEFLSENDGIAAVERDKNMLFFETNDGGSSWKERGDLSGFPKERGRLVVLDKDHAWWFYRDESLSGGVGVRVYPFDPVKNI